MSSEVTTTVTQTTTTSVAPVSGNTLPLASEKQLEASYAPGMASEVLKPDGTPVWTEDMFVGMTEADRNLKIKELEWNAKLDAELMKNPNSMPKAIYFIIPNEAAERFCYYGVKPLLKGFLGPNWVGQSPDFAAEMVHVFTMMSYFFPLIGAALADSFLTKFKTITLLSIVYLIGVILLAVCGTPAANSFGLAMTGLVLVALGTGGIKPCVSSHGGDQFLESQKRQLNAFYNYFYVAINLGSIASGFITPIIRQQTCYPDYPVPGSTGNCYNWAFGTCAIVMGVAIVIFVIGDRWYRVVPPTGTFVPWDVTLIMLKSMWRWFGASPEERANIRHFCALADDVRGPEMADEAIDVLKMSTILICCPFFWMAFDMNYTTWQSQGNCLQPLGLFNSEMASAVMNPILVVALVPFFTNLIYPGINKMGFKFGLATRIWVGMLVAGIAFFIAAGIQLGIQANCEYAVVDGEPVCLSPNLSIMLQWIPYFVITCGEILFSISGLNFTYEQVGKKMKASAAALWLLTSAFGNMLDAVLLSATNPTTLMPGMPQYTGGMVMSNFFWLIGGLCFIFGLIEAVVVRFYVYREDRPYHQADREEIIRETLAREAEVKEYGRDSLAKATLGRGAVAN